MNPDDGPALFLWVAVDSPDTPPSRLKVDSCLTCGALVPTVRFDTHGRWHRELGGCKPKGGRS